MVKWIKRIVATLVVIVATLLAYLKLALPNVGKAENIKIVATPEMVKRGEYLAYHVCACMDCHAHRDWTKFSGPPIEGTDGIGGDVFGKEFGFPGTFYAKNITPYALKNWTDGEIIRAITCGVDKNNVAMFPVMPYHNFGTMDKEDIKSIVAFLRTLKPIKNDIPASEPEFPMSLIINTIPKKAELVAMPSKDNVLDYGKYLVNAAACAECHTNAIKGKKVEGVDYAGGREFVFPQGKKIVSANITPDNETGLGYWTEATFVNKFKSFSDRSKLQDYKSPKDYQSIMPWSMYAGLDTTDLKAMFAYLQTLKPIKNKVEKNSVN